MTLTVIKRLTLLSAVLVTCACLAQEPKKQSIGTVLYLGNEGVLISTDYGKVLFDPFFHNDYGTYTLVPEEMRKAIFSGKEPYDDISAIVVSHAHGDHFSPADTLRYLKENKGTTLVGPDQAVDQVRALEGAATIESQLRSINVQVGDAVVETRLGSVVVESVRIPHAGWPGRQEVSNLVHRVTFGDELNVIHMGDADPNDLHFKPYKEHWDKSESEVAFPPYWFFTSRFGPAILSDRINAVTSVGVHVPANVPQDLKLTDEDFFSEPGETRDFIVR